MKSKQLSKTAAFVAIKFYGLTRESRFRCLFDNSVITFYDRIVESLPKPLSYYRYWLQFSWIRRCYILSEELLLSGDLLHIIARKWYMQRLTKKFISEDYEQIIILGAGFDHLGYYFSLKGLSCFEVEKPKMGQLKEHFFQEYYPDQPHPYIIKNSSANSFLPLSNPKIDPDKKTVVLAEGFFDYQTPHMVEKILSQIRSNFSHKTALVSTHFALDELSFLPRFVYKKSIQIVGEQLRLNLPAKAFKQMLTDQRFEITQCFDTHEISAKIHDQINTRLPLLKGFYILSARSRT